MQETEDLQDKQFVRIDQAIKGWVLLSDNTEHDASGALTKITKCHTVNVIGWGCLLRTEIHALSPDGTWSFGFSVVPLIEAFGGDMYSASTLTPTGRAIVGLDVASEEIENNHD